MAPAPPNGELSVIDKIAQALVNDRFEGPNRSDPKLMVMKNGEVDECRVKKEYNEIVNKGPAAIRWAHENKKLNMTKVDARLVNEVVDRPNLPDKVKQRVREILKEMVMRIQGGDFDDEDSDED